MSATALKHIQHKREISSIAMTVLLISLSMLFAALFLGYLLLRFSQTQWPPQSYEVVSLLIPSISSVFILLSSGSYEWMRSLYHAEKRLAFMGAWLLTFNLGLGFLVSQLFLWRELNATGLMASSGIFASIMHAFTWVHAAHVILALASFFYLTKLFRIDCEAKYHHWLLNVGKIWHFLAIVWLMMYLGIFVF